MRQMIDHPPCSLIEPVTDILHGVPITDPYRWLEDQCSQRTRSWIGEQTLYARSYLDAIPGRDRIRSRIRELIDVDSSNCILKAGNRCVFRKRMKGQEQASIFLRDRPSSKDQLLLDPAQRGTGPYTAVRPLRLSMDGRMLLYEVKQGGERAGVFELFDIEKRQVLPDALPHGYLRGFAFTPDASGFYYVHESIGAPRPHYRAAYRHTLGMRFGHDRQVFFAGEDEKIRLRLVAGTDRLAFLVYRLLEKACTDFYLWYPNIEDAPSLCIKNAEYKFGPLFLNDGRIVAITDRDAPNFRIVDVGLVAGHEPVFADLVPECKARIQDWMVTRDRLFVSYIRNLQVQIEIFDLHGKCLGQLPAEKGETARLVGASVEDEDLFFERESFTAPSEIYRYASRDGRSELWAKKEIPFDSQIFDCTQVWFSAKDGTRISMFLVGRRDVLAEERPHPTVMTSYGGYGIAMTPQFSVFVAFLMERGCLFALPNIRGGSEFGADWHNAAKRRKRQVAFDDFLSAAEWLIAAGRTAPRMLAIFGGSNSGLLVGVAMTQRPELFRAVVCMVPMLDMLRYHLFDDAHVWQEELGTSEDAEDFAALAAYSPYHRVLDGTIYPATMIVSGDVDQNCNPMHARKMTARLQAASTSNYLIILDYRPQRGHSPVLPLSDRIEALTDRMAFLCDQLEIPM